MRQVSFYEFAGILAPGGVVLISLSLIYPPAMLFIKNHVFTISDLGIFVILSYVIGHITQAIGNVIESLWWTLWDGRPMDWIRTRRHRIIAEWQLKNIETCVEQSLGKRLTELSKIDWDMFRRHMYAVVRSEGKSYRIDKYSGSYSLCRGIAASLLLVESLLLYMGWLSNWQWELISLFALAMTLFRMHRYASYYARQLVVEFLQVKSRYSFP